MYSKVMIPEGLPRTGQTTSYRAGDDASMLKGVPLTAAQRFRDNGDGTVLDFATGLQWVKEVQLIIPGPSNAAMLAVHNQCQVARGAWAGATDYAVGDLVRNGLGPYYACPVAHTSAALFATDLAAGLWRETIWTSSAANLTAPATSTWDELIDKCLALEYAGHSDWSCPNIEQLLSIMNHGGVDAEGNRGYQVGGVSVYPNIGSGADRRVSSTSVSDSTANAWAAEFYPGSNTTRSWAKGSLCITLPVRRGNV